MSKLHGDLCGRHIDGKLHLWEVAAISSESRELPTFEIHIDKLTECREEWFGHKPPSDSAHALAHAWPETPAEDAFPVGLSESGRQIDRWQWIKIMNADLAQPIILSAAGWVMDGAHRIAKAILHNRSTILCKQFAKDPPPGTVVEENE